MMIVMMMITCHLLNWCYMTQDNKGLCINIWIKDNTVGTTMKRMKDMGMGSACMLMDPFMLASGNVT